MQYTGFRDLEADEVFDIQGGKYDWIISYFDNIVNFIQGIFHK